MDPQDRVAELEQQLAAAREAVDQQGRSGRPHGGPPQSGASGFDGRGSWSVPRDDRLAAAPRRVPFAFVLAELLPFRWWYVWALFMIAVAPIAIWIEIPVVVAPVAVLTLCVIYVVQFLGTRNRIALLRYGRVVTVVGTDVVSRGSYYSGTTWYNAPLPVARGWAVTRPLYSGPSTRTRIRYTIDGHQGQLVVRGREYVDGVVLADGRTPARALCVTSFPYALDRDDAGRWVGRIRPRLAVGMACWAVIVVGWLALALLVPGAAAVRSGAGSSSVAVAQGGKLVIADIGKTRTVACGDGYLTVGGATNTVTVTGHCLGLTVSGNGNHVIADDVDAIRASGVGNRITYRAGSPRITNSGISTTVQKG